MTTTNTNTIGASGADYSTIASWEADTDNDLREGTGSDSIEVGALLNETHTISTQVQLIGATTDADHYRILGAVSGTRYNPIADTGPKVVMTGDGHVVLLSEQGSRIRDIGLFLSGNAQTSGRQCLRFTADTVNSHGSPCYVDRIFCSVDDAADQDHTGIRAYANSANLDAPIIIRNSVVAGNGAATKNFLRGIDTTSEGINGVTIENCVAYGCRGNGIYLPVNSAANTARNCVSSGNAAAAYQIASGGSNMTLVSLAADDTSAVGTGAVTSIVPADAFTAPASNDFTLKTGSVLIDAGVDLSAFFTTDLAGNLHGRNGTWDIGAYDFRGYPLTRIAQTFAITDREEATMHFTNREEATCRIS